MWSKKVEPMSDNKQPVPDFVLDKHGVRHPFRLATLQELIDLEAKIGGAFLKYFDNLRMVDLVELLANVTGLSQADVVEKFDPAKAIIGAGIVFRASISKTYRPKPGSKDDL
jgi:hypothetical protein